MTALTLDLLRQGSAVISPCERYRYRLSREWGDGPRVLFVMLNPSTADATQDDPTIRRCIGFARAWGMGGLWIGNLFAYRATKPADMLAADDPVGPENMAHLAAMAEEAALLVCAWGAHGSHHGQDRAVLSLLAGHRPHALRLTSKGAPSHPLYLPGDLQPVPLPLAPIRMAAWSRRAPNGGRGGGTICGSPGKCFAVAPTPSYGRNRRPAMAGKLTAARKRVLSALIRQGGKASPYDLAYPRHHMMHQLEMDGLVTTEGRLSPWGEPTYEGFYVITDAGRAALAREPS